MLELLSLIRRDKPSTVLSDDNTVKKKAKDEDTSSVSSYISADDEDVEPERDSDDGEMEYFDEEKLVGEFKFPKRTQNDRPAYRSLQEVWKQDKDNRRTRKGWMGFDNEDAFMTFEEYISLREKWLARWVESSRDMLDTPEQMEVDLVPKVRELIEHGMVVCDELDWYQKWVVSMYGEEVAKRFGRLEAVDPNLIPIGMLQPFKSSRMKLDQ